MPGKLAPQNYQEMVSEGREKRANSKLYKEESSKYASAEISKLVNQTAAELTTVATNGAVSLRNTDKVKKQTMLYLKSCEDSSVIPSISGLARALGHTRQSIYDCLHRKSPAATAQWLEICKDSFSDVLAETSLRNNCNSICAIFLQKSMYNMRETVEIVAKTENPLGEDIDLIELQKRIEGNVVIDDDE